MDGLLLDSEVLWHEAEVEIFGALGVPLERDATRETKGMYVTEVVRYWRARHPWREPSDEAVTAKILDRVGALVESKGRLMPGALRALDLTAARGPVGLASSTPTALIERSLAHFGLRARFSVVASAADEAAGKPDPAVFLTAARRLGVPGSACLALEDSAAGVIAAKAASMTCVAVPEPDERNRLEFASADLILDTLTDLDERWLDERFRATEGGASGS